MSVPGEIAKAHVARLYFEQDVTKREIAQRLGISRFKVARLLDQARSEGIVRVEIHDPVAVEGELSRALEERYGIAFAVVVGDEAAIPRATAAWLPELLPERGTLGVAWGATLQQVAAELPEASGAGTEVVQVCGAVPGLEPGTGPTELALRFAERLGGRLHALPAPAMASRRARDELMANDVVRPTVELFDRLDLVLVGVGAAGRLAGAPADAVGHVLVHAFDADGRFVDTAAADRAISMSRDQLAATRVLAAAGGRAKHAAVRGALCSGLLDALVTDAGTARHALRGAS
ncbi:MAG TPA: sugar-binding domain-containing protein [Baekduia sp.]|nr:sugar-binding domain-containing protein [Baekduia sp.]